MKVTEWNDGWKYWVDTNAFALVWNIPDYAREVTLPHDAMLEGRAYSESRNGGNTGFRDGGVYQYVKCFRLEKEMEGRTFFLKFEGVYMNAFVYVNGALAGKCPYGYTGFYVSLNDYLNFGEENEVRVTVRNGAMPNSRWYSGGGIYRDVYLLSGAETYILPEGLQGVTEDIDKDIAVVKISTSMKNRGRRKALRLVTDILDREGNILAAEEIPLTLYEGEERRMETRLAVEKPESWSAESPHLYQIRSRLYEGEALLDEATDIFGIRTLGLDAKRGLRVNGKSVKLRGACIHHDSGILGAATFYDAEYRRVRILKEAGFNAVRMAHHPAAPALLRACDELGMYVMDEAFDMWTRCKSDYDYALFFSECWEKDVEAMVKKDYNHPSVILYSTGNEIPEVGTDQGAQLGRNICEKIKALDSTRYTLASVNGVFSVGDRIPEIMDDLKAAGAIDGNVNDFMTLMGGSMDDVVVHKAITERLDMACANTDIAGYNYMAVRYEKDGADRPNRIIVGSETNPPDIAFNWNLVEKCGHVIGDFTWTGWDYIGEAGIGVPSYRPGEGGFGAAFPYQLAYCGDMDITGFRRPMSYLREIVFGLRRDPYLAVQDPRKYGMPVFKTPWILSDAVSSWTWKGCEGKPVVVEIYAPGDSVELFLNGRSLGRKAAGRKEGYRVFFETVYEPGVLEAVSREGEREIGRTQLCTAQGNGTLTAEVEEGITGTLAYVELCNLDGNGTLITDEDPELWCEAPEEAEVWFGSGDPKPEFDYRERKTRTWHGRALLAVRRPEDGRTLKLRVCSRNGSVEVEL